MERWRGKKCISTDLIHVNIAIYYSISKQFEDFHYSQRELEYEKMTCMLRHIMYYLTNNFNILLEFYPFPWHQSVPWLQRSLALTKTVTLTKNCMQQRRECGGALSVYKKQAEEIIWIEKRKKARKRCYSLLAIREVRGKGAMWLPLVTGSHQHTDKGTPQHQQWWILTDQALRKFLH